MDEVFVLLISVHIPKTAGTSLRFALQEAYGIRFLTDYKDDRPLVNGIEVERERLRVREDIQRFWPEIKSRYDVVHGHFRADKYLFDRDNIRLATFFREPISRTFSLYHQVQRPTPDRQAPPAAPPYEVFASRPEMVYYYELYLDKLQPEDFDFVGITERYAESIALFNRMFDKELDVKELNKAGGEREIPELPDAFHRPNIIVYEKALRRFDTLYKEYFPGGS